MWCASVQSMRTQSPGHCLFLPLLPCICYTFCRPVLSHSFFICFHCSFLVLYQCEIFRKSSRAPVLSHASLFWALYIMIIKRVTNMVCHPTRVRLPEGWTYLAGIPCAHTSTPQKLLKWINTNYTNVHNSSFPKGNIESLLYKSRQTVIWKPVYCQVLDTSVWKSSLMALNFILFT